MNNMSRLFTLLNGNDPLIAQFEQFRKTFTGDPKQQIQAMLDSGQLSQEDFDRLAKRATELRKVLLR